MRRFLFSVVLAVAVLGLMAAESQAQYYLRGGRYYGGYNSYYYPSYSYSYPSYSTYSYPTYSQPTTQYYSTYPSYSYSYPSYSRGTVVVVR